MSTFGVAMVKDEADVIGPVVRHMLTQVDEVIVADNGSTDGTRDILDALPIIVLDDDELAYFQSRKMTQLAHIAGGKGARWVVPFDADEHWSSQWGRLADVLDEHHDDYGIVTAELYDYVATAFDDPDVTNPIQRMRWRRATPLPLPKVACRTDPTLTIEQGNHYARYDVPARATETPAFTVRHFPYRSVAQLIKKVRNGAAAYAATDLPESAGAHWRQWGRFTDEQIADLFQRWYFRDDPGAAVTIDGEEHPSLIFDPVVL